MGPLRIPARFTRWSVSLQHSSPPRHPRAFLHPPSSLSPRSSLNVFSLPCRRFASTSATTTTNSFPGYVKAALALGAGLTLTAFVFSTSPRVQSHSAPTSSPSTSKASSSAQIPVPSPTAAASALSDVHVTDSPAHSASKADVSALVNELRDALGDSDRKLEKVSTDADVLHLHGWSDNDYHPGECPV